jgi:hypothetical protein
MRYRFKKFGNRVLRRIFETKREEAIGGWRRLHNKELQNSYPSQILLRLSKQGG